MIIRLAEATPENSGTKAAVLGRLLRAGFPVPPGFVIPINTHRAATANPPLPPAPSDHHPPETRHPDQIRHPDDARHPDEACHPDEISRLDEGRHADQTGQPDEVRRSEEGGRLVGSWVVPGWLVDEVRGALEELGDCLVAVRSSAAGEDSPTASAAGQYDSYLGIRGVPAVVDKVQATWASLWSHRAMAYRQAFGQEPGQRDGTAPGIAVIVQRQVHADVAGVLFTADRRTPDNSTPTGPAGTSGAVAVLEASWGLGESVVQGLVNPDSYSLSASGGFSRRLGTKSARRDAGPAGGVVVSEVPLEERERFCLDERLVRRVMELGRAVAAELDGPQDIEFAVEGDQVWILQARPITAPLASADTTNQKPAVLLEMEPPAVLRGAEGVGGEGPGVLRADGHGGLRGEARAGVLRGVGGSAGVASGPARVVEGVGDFGRVEVGDILVCRFTDPAWTPLFGVVAGVVTEVGGRLSHAAIVARERRIPAVLGVSGVMSAVEDGQVITIVGDAGTVSAPGLGRT